VGEIRAVAVIGAGTMGRGIAQTAAVAGYDVVVADADQAALARGLASIHDTLAMLVEKGKIGAAERHAALARLTTSPSLAEGVSGADLVVEAVPESLELKSGIFRELDAPLPRGRSSPAIPRRCRSVSSPRRRAGPTGSSACTSSIRFR